VVIGSATAPSRPTLAALSARRKSECVLTSAAKAGAMPLVGYRDIVDVPIGGEVKVVLPLDWNIITATVFDVLLQALTYSEIEILSYASKRKPEASCAKSERTLEGEPGH
jgi:hypothetical protein